MHPDLPPLTALYAQRARLLTNRRPARDYGNLVRVERTAAAYTRAAKVWGIAWRVMFYAILAVVAGIAIGLLVHLALVVTRR